MPKDTKRTAAKRAARIAKAHATQLPKLQVKEPPRRAPGYKPPSRGIARYPWASIILTLLIIGLGIFTLYYYHLGPFARPVVTKPAAAVSPCLKIVSKLTDTSPAPTAAEIKNITHTYANPPAMAINVNKLYCAGINTNRGLIVLQLDPKLAPNTVNNFVFLAQHHFYDGLVFHRVIQSGSGIHIIQTGDPKGNGSGGPGYKFNDEPVKGAYTAGCVAMANSGPNTNGSQFFICTGNDTSLPKSYNLFGQVVQGLDVAQKIQGPGDDPASKNIKPDVIDHLIVVQAP
jgi:cyclophilin family peptidyl-prolyl cis-trans isomerase